MTLINFPFDEVAFSKESKILLDACIILGLIDDEDRMHKKCVDIIEKLLKQDVKFYVSNVVLAEVLNKTITNLFIDDLQNIFHEKEINNSLDNLDVIFNQLKITDANILLNIESDYKDLRTINYKLYFNNINKNKNKSIRDTLQIYFEKADELCSRIEDNCNLKFLLINENTMKYARDMSNKYMLGINDAQHLSTAKTYRMDYIMSTDGDFIFVQDELKVKYLRVS